MDNKKIYGTKQRNFILDFFKSHRNECFSAKFIIENNGMNIGEATIYRLLAKLTAEGKLKRFIADKGLGATYQYNDTEQCDSHFHLKCLNCGETVCIDCLFMHGMEKHVESEHEFSVDNTKTILFGTCKVCKQKI